MTPYAEIFNLFLSKINDYYLKNKLKNEPEFADELMLDFLRTAIPKFKTYCVKDLYNRDDNLFQFNIELDDMEKDILSILMVAEYLNPKINREQYIEHSVGSKDYTEYSPNNQLEQLREWKKQIKSEADSLILEYYYGQGD